MNFKNQKGFAPLLILIMFAVMGTGVYFYSASNNKPKSAVSPTLISNPSPSPSISPSPTVSPTPKITFKPKPKPTVVKTVTPTSNNSDSFDINSLNNNEEVINAIQSWANSIGTPPP